MNKNELFANKLEKFIISEVEEKVKKLKGLNVLEATLKLTSEDLYEYIDNNIGDSEKFTLKICVLQDSNTPAVEFTIHKCELHGKESLDPSELSELNSLVGCECESCESCKYYEKEEVNLLKNK